MERKLSHIEYLNFNAIQFGSSKKLFWFSSISIDLNLYCYAKIKDSIFWSIITFV